MTTLKSFLNGARRNAYIKYPGFNFMYVRHTKRFGIEVIDLANLEAKEPGRGSFARLVKHIRKTYPHLGIYVECVLNERFEGKLLAMGFTRCDVGMSACFYLSPEMELNDQTSQRSPQRSSMEPA
jgi:hypothetical protein